MKYVLDSSVALKFVLPEVDSGKAVRLRDDYRKSIHDLISPDIFTVRSRERTRLGRAVSKDQERRVGDPSG
jgi:hypothetical protein